MNPEDPAVAEFGLRITRAQREYFNYRYDDASFRAELAKLYSVRPPGQRVTFAAGGSGWKRTGLRTPSASRSLVFLELTH